MNLRPIFAEFNIRARCRNYRVPLRQCPQLLFVVMGSAIAISSVVSYGVGVRYVVDPQLAAFAILVMAIVLLVITFAIVQGFEKVAEVSRLKSEFISIVSHQLRTPITNLRWSVDMLLSGHLDHMPISEKQQEYFQILNQNIARMNELVQDLLTVSRLEQGRLPSSPKEIVIKDFIKDLLAKFDPTAKIAEVNLQLNIDGDIPNALIDPSQLKIVMENLFSNAIRYSKKDGVVRVKVVKKRGDVAISVQDAGIGIPKEDQKFLFQKFFRADNARTHQPQGTGLGLYIAKMLLDGFKGTISFESQQNKGSTFWITLPVKS